MAGFALPRQHSPSGPSGCSCPGLPWIIRPCSLAGQTLEGTSFGCGQQRNPMRMKQTQGSVDHIQGCLNIVFWKARGKHAGG